MEENKGGLIRPVVSALLMVALGVLLLMWPLYSFASMVIALGWVLTVGGAVGLVVCLVKWGIAGVGELMGALAALLFGIMILIWPGMATYMVGVIVCLQVVFRAVGALIQGISLKKSGLSVIPNLILTVLMLVLGCFMLCWPLISARWMIMGLGGLLIAGAVVDLVVRVVGAAKLRKAQKAAK